MRKLVLSIGVLILLLVIVLGARTATFRSRQVVVEPAPREAVDELAAAARLGAALRYRTISVSREAPPASEEFFGLHAYLESAFPLAHAALERETVGALSLLYTWRGSDPALAPLLLTGHLDVVPVDPATEHEWRHPPFDGVVAEGHVWGRGALDDKASVVAILEAVEALVAEGFAPRRSVHLAFGHDEEIGGTEGAGRIARLLGERGVRPAMVLDEGGMITVDRVRGLARPAALVAVAEKGYVSLDLTVEALGGHSSMPPRQTAIGILAAALVRLERNRFPARLDGVPRQTFEFVGPELPLSTRAVLANLWLFRPLVERQLLADQFTAASLRTTTAPTLLAAGVKDNILPQRARATVNFRIRPGETVESVTDRVRRIIDDERVRITPHDGMAMDPSPVSPVDVEEFSILQRTIGEVFPGVVVAPFLTLGATDARHYTDLSPNVYRFLPITATGELLATVHGVNERVEIVAYADAIRFYRRLLEVTAAPPPVGTAEPRSR